MARPDGPTQIPSARVTGGCALGSMVIFSPAAVTLRSAAVGKAPTLKAKIQKALVRMAVTTAVDVTANVFPSATLHEWTVVEEKRWSAEEFPRAAQRSATD